MSEEKEYDLKTSIDKLGMLIPPTEDAHGNLIDGVHRDKLVPNCKRIRLEHISDPLQLILARMATNLCRRIVPPEEKTQWLRDLIALTNWTPKEIADKTGMSERWVHKYLPEEHKKPEPEQLASARRALVECSRCHMASSETVERKGENLCPTCLVKAKYKPERSAVEIKPRVTTTITKPKETWAHRKAVMTPQTSKMENTILIKLAEKGLHPETDKDFCLQTTRPDYYWPGHNLAIYLDGVVHKGKEDRDTALRELLRRRHGVKVVSIMYEGDSEATENQIVQDIMEAVK